MSRRLNMDQNEARAPRPTRAAALVLAVALSIPVWAVLTLLDYGLR